MKKRIISSVMCLAMLLSLLPVSAFAAGQFTLTYNENKPAGASAVQVENFPDPATVTADDTEMVTKPETDPTLEGYVFGGWFTDADCTSGNEVDFDSPFEPFPKKRTQKVKKKWNDSRGIRYRWLCSGAEKIILKTRGRNPTQSRVRAEGVVEDFQIGKDIALRRRSGWIVF